MSKLKLCGLRREQDIAWANELRPDYVGFVFAPSKRQVSAQEAAALRAALDPAIPAVGVFVNAPVAEIAALCRAGTIDLVQLHGDEDAAYRAALRGLTDKPLIQAARVGEMLPPLADDADYLLFDALRQGQYGGTGQSFDWSLIRHVRRPYFLAGGLGAHNVEQAIRTLRPHCVDLSSAVETNGAKDYNKMKQLVELVRRSC